MQLGFLMGNLFPASFFAAINRLLKKGRHQFPDVKF